MQINAETVDEYIAQIPLNHIGELTSRISVNEWIQIYENKLKR